MPGIAGIISRNPNEVINRDLGLMVESMRHEKDYVGSHFVNREMGLHVGWLCHQGSLGEYMPLMSQDRKIVLVILGEHFSHSGDLPPLGRNAREAGKELLRLYEESGENSLTALNGWFCGVILDSRLGKVTVFNDRYSMGRVYFHEDAEEFVFASEAKALLRIRPSLRTIEPSALAQFLRSNCVMGNKTLFKGISLLPGASSWTFKGAVTPEKRSYFDFADWENQSPLEPEELHRRFGDSVSKIIPAYMESMQRIGLSLTAGIDTRMILATKDQGRILPCYTFGGLWGETFDIRTARELARICGVPHTVIRINEGFFQDFPTYAQKAVYVSDGTHEMMGAHDVYFNKVARDIAPIRVTGKFGSEVVRIRRLIPLLDFPRHLAQAGLVTYLDEVPTFEQISQKTHPLTRVVSEEIPWSEFGKVAVEQAATTLRTPYLDNQLVKLMYRATSGLRACRDLQARYVKERDRRLSDVLTDMGRVREDGNLLGRIIHIMYRVWFKEEFIYLYATPHWLTWVDRRLEALKPERLLAGRHKFEGYRIWIKTHLSNFVRETLLNPQARCTEFFDKPWIAKIVERHIAGTHNYFREINKIMSVELLCSTLLAPASSAGRASADRDLTCLTPGR